MLYTQLFRGPTSVAPYPSSVYEELFKLQTTSAEPESTEITIPDPTRLGLPELDGVTSITAINITGEAVNFSPRAAAVILYGSVERVPSGTVSEEVHDAYVDRIIRLAHIPLRSAASPEPAARRPMCAALTTPSPPAASVLCRAARWPTRSMPPLLRRMVG